MKTLFNILSGTMECVRVCHSEYTAKVGSCVLSCSKLYTGEFFYNLFYRSGFSDFFEMIIAVQIFITSLPETLTTLSRQTSAMGIENADTDYNFKH